MRPTESRQGIGLSKSRVMAGLQCHKRLWWTVCEHDAPELQPDDELQATFDRGSRVTEIARRHVPGGVLIDIPYRAYDERVERTRRAIADGASTIYEASFRADGVFVAVDILERVGSAFRLIEVKSSTWLKDNHIADVAVQAHVVRQSAIDLARLQVMHLNRECAYPDLSNLFVRVDVTDRVKAIEADVPRWIAEQTSVLDGPLPEIKTGAHCRSPYDCPFMARCWPVLPAHHVNTLYRMKLPQAAVFDERGYKLITDLPDDFPLQVIQERQWRAVREKRVIVEASLADALKTLVHPIAFLDFETVALAIPVWSGCHPYDFVPVQFSCHLQDADGAIVHHEWLTEGPDDPRREIARRLVVACAGANTVVAYGARFERQCIEHLAEAAPELATALREVEGRLVDLLSIVRHHVYHPEFGGGFSLKKVLPALVPKLRYDDLPIAEGSTATLQLERLLFDEDRLEPSMKEWIRASLLRYCHQDTWGLVKLIERLRAEAEC